MRQCVCSSVGQKQIEFLLLTGTEVPGVSPKSETNACPAKQDYALFIGCVVQWLERVPDKNEVGGSIPPTPIKNFRAHSLIAEHPPCTRETGVQLPVGPLLNINFCSIFKVIKNTASYGLKARVN